MSEHEIKIQWHPGFVAAMDLELSANRKDLIYEKEYNLNTKPLEIDLLVIKKESHVQIENEIGCLFRGHNIMEYKSPEDQLNIDTFYKAGAYASLYKSYGKTVDNRKADDITVSIVRETRPNRLFQYFKEHDIHMESPFPGIYYILDGVLFPTQLIVTGELEGSNHMWLKSLSGRLKKQELKSLLERIDRLTFDFDRKLADAVLEVSIRANQETVEELKGDEKMCQALLEIMEPEINEITEKAVKKAVDKVSKETAERVSKETAERVAKETADKEARETAINMLRSGNFLPEEIKRYIPRLSIEEIKTIAKTLA
jgi:hypothetical protein